MRTQPTQHTRTWTQPIEAVGLAMRVKRYIDLCDAISKSSSDVIYRSLRWLNHLEQLKRTLYPMLLPTATFRRKDIAQFSLIVRSHLVGILPLASHPSFQECQDTIDKIINDCQKISQKTSA